MPYADLEKRREYHREYSRRRRGLTNPENPLAGFKVYLCFEFPHLNLSCSRTARTLYFRHGFFVTDNAEEQATIEAHEYFGKYIWPLALASFH